MIGLCDCNNFFVSCERVFNPALEGRPVLVLSSNDGCVIARSNESKALGIKMGVPLFQVKSIVEQHQVQLFSSNFQLYGDMSNRVFSTLRQHVPQVEVYSIDEAFLDLRGLDLNTLQQWGQEVSKMVKRNVGIPVSIGIAPTKTLAKVASQLCKKYPKLHGCCLMYRPEDITKVLNTYPIDEIWGIGRQSAKKLKQVGVFTAEQFRQLPQSWIRKELNINGVRTWKELHGEPCIELEHGTAARQSICVSRSFAQAITQKEKLQEVISNFLATAAQKLRKQQSVASQLQVFAATNRFQQGVNQQFGSQLITFSTPTESTFEMMNHAMKAIDQFFIEGNGYKKAGVIISGIQSNKAVQTALFDTVDRNKHKTIMETVDFINQNIGTNSVTLALQNQKDTTTSRNHLSPRYTTHWNEILVVHCNRSGETASQTE